MGGLVAGRPPVGDRPDRTGRWAEPSHGLQGLLCPDPVVPLDPGRRIEPLRPTPGEPGGLPARGAHLHGGDRKTGRPTRGHSEAFQKKRLRECRPQYEHCLGRGALLDCHVLLGHNGPGDAAKPDVAQMTSRGGEGGGIPPCGGFFHTPPVEKAPPVVSVA